MQVTQLLALSRDRSGRRLTLCRGRPDTVLQPHALRPVVLSVAGLPAPRPSGWYAVRPTHFVDNTH